MCPTSSTNPKQSKSELVIIVESGRCSHGRCIFCSFSKKPEVLPPDFERLKKDLDSKLTHHHEIVKYFNSGSFLDINQIPAIFQKYLIEKCIQYGVEELIIECLPEHINEGNLSVIKNVSGRKNIKICFALGLEVADDAVLKKICKGFKRSDYLNSVSLLKKEGFLVRTYLMANLPFVDNVSKSLDKSVRFALQNSDSLAIINSYAYGYAPLFDLWMQNKWHPLSKKEFDALVKKYRTNKKIDIYFDDYISYPRFSNQEHLKGATVENLENPAYNVWQDYIDRFYEVPKEKKYALFLPCAFRKPYSTSKTHREIMRRLVPLPFYATLHQVMISNPGVIPREFEGKYPFAHYDWPEWEETPAIKRKYVEVTQKRVENYLSNHHYNKIFAYFKPSSESYEALKNACKKLKIQLINCTDDSLYSEIIGASDEGGGNILIERRMLDGLVRCLRRNI